MSNQTSIPDITRSVEDAVSYPILTRETGSYGEGGDVLTSRVGGGSALSHSAQTAIREALGWRYRSSDVKGFLAALNKSFALKEVEGHVEWGWQPQNFTLQADLGEVTGAQASIYARAKVILDQALPLLDGLSPLRPDADEEDIASVRAIIRTEVTELVGELGAVGGPRVQRVDSLFKLLLGDNPDVQNPESVGGQFRQLRDRLGLESKRVNTVEEEQNLTNFLILADYVKSLWSTWHEQRKYFDRRGKADPFLGTQLVLLSQALEVVTESVREAYEAMDSVFFGAAERQTERLRLGENESPITVGELLGWVENFATNEGRQLIMDAGKDGVVAFSSTMEKLTTLAGLAWEKSKEPSGNPSRGFHTVRVQRALGAVKDHLEETKGLAGDVRRFPRPSITRAECARVQGGKKLDVIVEGSDFQEGAEVRLNPSHESEMKSVSGTTTAQGRTISIVAQFEAQELVKVKERVWAELLAMNVADRAKTVAKIFRSGTQSLATRGLSGQPKTPPKRLPIAWTVIVKNPDGGLDRKPDSFWW